MRNLNLSILKQINLHYILKSVYCTQPPLKPPTMKNAKLSLTDLQELLALPPEKQAEIIKQILTVIKDPKSKSPRHPITIRATNYWKKQFGTRLVPKTITRTPLNELSQINRQLAQGTITKQDPKRPNTVEVNHKTQRQLYHFDLNVITNHQKLPRLTQYKKDPIYTVLFCKCYLWTVAKKTQSLQSAISFQDFLTLEPQLIDIILELRNRNIPEKHWLWHVDFLPNPDTYYTPIILPAPQSEHTTQLYSLKHKHKC